MFTLRRWSQTTSRCTSALAWAPPPGRRSPVRLPPPAELLLPPCRPQLSRSARDDILGRTQLSSSLTGDHVLGCADGLLSGKYGANNIPEDSRLKMEQYQVHILLRSELPGGMPATWNAEKCSPLPRPACTCGTTSALRLRPNRSALGLLCVFFCTEPGEELTGGGKVYQDRPAEAGAASVYSAFCMMLCMLQQHRTISVPGSTPLWPLASFPDADSRGAELQPRATEHRLVCIIIP